MSAQLLTLDDFRVGATDRTATDRPLYWHDAGRVFRDAGGITHDMPDNVARARLARLEAVVADARSGHDWPVHDATAAAARTLRLAIFKAESYRAAAAVCAALRKKYHLISTA